MKRNRVVCVSLFRGLTGTNVTITRNTYRRVYRDPGYRSKRILCEVVSARARAQTMGLFLWPEGFWANVLIERA